MSVPPLFDMLLKLRVRDNMYFEKGGGKMAKRRFGELVLDIIFPPRCPVCGEVVAIGAGVCADCSGRLYHALHKLSLCDICGKTEESCICNEKELIFERCVSAFCYDEAASPMMIELKNRLMPDVTEKVALLMKKALTESGITANEIDCITEVPMSEERIAAGRVNCSREMALVLSRMLGIPHREPPFIQNDDYRPQHSLSSAERAENADRGYSPLKGGRIDKTVLLIDDIMTTGSTLRRCSELLIECGADRVICLTAATTLKKPPSLKK